MYELKDMYELKVLGGKRRFFYQISFGGNRAIWKYDYQIENFRLNSNSSRFSLSQTRFGPTI